MGASDRYVVRQFELHALARGLRGAALGFACGVIGFLAAVELAGRFGGDLVQHVALRPVDWVVLAIVPVLVVLLITLATRFAAAWGLARLR
jgi:cell division protein FtsX